MKTATKYERWTRKFSASKIPMKSTFLLEGSLACFIHNRTYIGMRNKVKDWGSLIPVQKTNVGVRAKTIVDT
jgi:hypothetical protein